MCIRDSPKYLRWWQVRPIDFSLFLFPLIVQRALLLPLWILAMTYADDGETPMSLALDTTYAGWDSPKTLLKIIILGWVLLIIATASAFIERCYQWQKAALIFLVLAVLMIFLSLNAINLYEPYLAVRR